ncbi:hypothetical protein [Saccharothrix sp.]|uniref:hypothetical protein n=1 Tax=Saccharothrix sp. TaxID=1873460 RepID=UPI0028124142|nr:hypothetical protein [Saccharothrix sp.]
MCVSSGTACFSHTILYAGLRDHPEHGPITVFGHQNTAVNHVDGPNCLILHLPTNSLNLIPTGRSTDLLTRLREPTEPDFYSLELPAQASIVPHDVYTVVLAPNPTHIPTALEAVPPSRRPTLSPDLLEFYADTFPGHAIALCCFDNAEARRSKPLLLWYRPTDPDLVVLPGLHSHAGRVPDPIELVPTDHYLLFGTDDPDWGEHYEHDPAMRHTLRSYLPASVRGYPVTKHLRNGDYALKTTDLRSGAIEKIRRRRF